ncbi:MAG: Gfo/Idh/MocA family oxidoreductase, partial [Candidatus Latescibacteria bacterium]|nr:Gfo/Idh/MocA family oxidoreductase [Candidatus Latescibacterota bacterium]
MNTRDHIVRVAVYGAGSWANQTHIPNLLKLDGVEIVALCDINPQALQSTAMAFNIPKTYEDGHQMVEHEEIDVLFSVVPAFARTDVEATAAAKGIHLFSEKPQALTMKVACAIDTAIRQAGVLSTVCFRERYRPLFQKARNLLNDKQIVHIRFQSIGSLPAPPPPGEKDDWKFQMEKAGGSAFDWGVHAVDYARFMSGLNVVRAHAFYCQRPAYHTALSSSFNFLLSNGATMAMTFVAAAPPRLTKEPWFTIYYEGGYVAIHGYAHIEVNGEIVYQAEEFDPWFEQDRIFIEAVRSGDGSAILNDYHDGLFSLAPVLAGWESARCNGECRDVASF